MKAIIKEGCIGCGQCAMTCPDVFEMNEDGLAEVVGIVNDSNIVDATEAANGCPVQVIEVE